MNQAITDYIENIDQPWQAEVCHRLRRCIHQAVPGVEERIQYGKPHFVSGGKYVSVLGTARGWVNLTIFQASALEAPEGYFEAGGSPDRKTVKIREGQAVEYDFLARLVQQA